MPDNNFTRKEIKYKLDAQAFAVLQGEFAPYLERHQYHFQKIHNIYFDSRFDEIIGRSIEGPVFKEKLRMRAYENNGELCPYAFIEIKKKYKGIVYKRRLKISLQEASDIFCGTNPATILKDSQAAKEILFLIQKTECYPKMYLSYDRRSYIGRAEDDLRITFDSNILSRRERLDFTADWADVPLLPPNEYIMEIKSAFALPLWLTDILTKNKIFPQSFSKYGNVYIKSLTDGKYFETKTEDGVCA